MRKLSLSSLWKSKIIRTIPILLAGVFMAGQAFADAPNVVSGLGSNAVMPTGSINTSTPIFTWAPSSGTAGTIFWSSGNANTVGYVIVIATSSDAAVLTDYARVNGSTPTVGVPNKAPWFFVFNSTMNPQPFTSSATALPSTVANGTVSFNFGVFASTFGVMLRNNSTYFYNIAAFHIGDTAGYSGAISSSIFISHPNANPTAAFSVRASSGGGDATNHDLPLIDATIAGANPLLATVSRSSPTFSWVGADVDGDSVTYRVDIAENIGFTTNLRQYGFGSTLSTAGFSGSSFYNGGQDIVWQQQSRTTFTFEALNSTSIVNQALGNATNFIRIITFDKNGGASTSTAFMFFVRHALTTGVPAITTSTVTGDVIQTGTVGTSTPTFSWATPSDVDNSTFTYRVIITTANLGAADTFGTGIGRYPYYIFAVSSATVNVQTKQDGSLFNIAAADLFTNGNPLQNVGRTTFTLSNVGPLLSGTSYYVRVDVIEWDPTMGSNGANISTAAFNTLFYTGNYNTRPQAAGISILAQGANAAATPVVNVATPTITVTFVSTGVAAGRVDNEGNDLQVRIEFSTNSAFPNDTALSAYTPSDGGYLGFGLLKSTSAGWGFGTSSASLVAGSYTVFVSSALHPYATHFVRVIVTDTGTAAGVGLSTTSAVGAFYIRPLDNSGLDNIGFANLADGAGDGAFIATNLKTNVSTFTWTDTRFWRLHHGFPGMDGPTDDAVGIFGTTVTIPASTSVQAGTVTVAVGGVLSMQQTGALLTANVLRLENGQSALGPSLKMAGGSTVRFRNTGNTGPFGLIARSPQTGTSRNVIIATGTSASPVTIDAEDPTNGKVEFQAVFADITMNWVNFNGFDQTKSTATSGVLTSQPAAIRLINVRTSSNTATAPSETAGLLANLSFSNTGSSSTLLIDGATITLSGINMNGQTFGVRTALSGNFISTGTISTTSVSGTIQNYAGLHKNPGANVLFNTNIAPGPVANLSASPSGVADILVTWSSPGEDATLGSLLASDYRKIIFTASSTVQSALDSIFSVAFTSFQANTALTEFSVSTGPSGTGGIVRARAITELVIVDTAAASAQDISQNDDSFALNGSTQQYFYRVAYQDQQGIWSALSNSASAQIQTNDPPAQIATSTILLNGSAPTNFASTSTVGLNFVSTNSHRTIHDETPTIAWNSPGDNNSDVLFFEVLIGTSLATGSPLIDSPPVSGSTTTPFGTVSTPTVSGFFKLNHLSSGTVLGWSGSPDATPPVPSKTGIPDFQSQFTLYGGSGTNNFGEDLTQVGGLFYNATYYITIRAWDSKGDGADADSLPDLTSTGTWSTPVAFILVNSSPSWGAPQTPQVGVGLTTASLTLGTTLIHTITPVIGFTLPGDADGDNTVFRVQIADAGDPTFVTAFVSSDTVISSHAFTLRGSTGSYVQGSGTRNQSDGQGRGGFYQNIPGTSVFVGGTLGVGASLGWGTPYIARVIAADAPSQLGPLGFGGFPAPADESFSTTTVSLAFKVVNSSPDWTSTFSRTIQMSTQVAGGGAGAFFNLSQTSATTDTTGPNGGFGVGLSTNTTLSWANPDDSDSDSLTYRIWIGTNDAAVANDNVYSGSAFMRASTLSATGFSPATTSFVEGVNRSSYTLSAADVIVLKQIANTSLTLPTTYYIRVLVQEDIAGFGRVFPATSTLLGFFQTPANTAPAAVSSITISVALDKAAGTFTRKATVASNFTRHFSTPTLSWQVPSDADLDPLHFIVRIGTSQAFTNAVNDPSARLVIASTDTTQTLATFTGVPASAGAGSATMTFTQAGLNYLTSRFRPDATWYFRVGAFDGTVESSTGATTTTDNRNYASTGSFVIQNSSPQFIATSIPGQNEGGLTNGTTIHTRTPVFRFSAVDPDGDALFFRLRISSGGNIGVSGNGGDAWNFNTIAGVAGYPDDITTPASFGVAVFISSGPTNFNAFSGTWTAGTAAAPYVSQSASTPTFTLHAANALVHFGNKALANNQLTGYNATFYWDLSVFDNSDVASALSTTSFSSPNSNSAVAAPVSSMSFVLVNSSPSLAYNYPAAEFRNISSGDLLAGTTLFRWTSSDADSDSVMYCLMVASSTAVAPNPNVLDGIGAGEFVSSSTVLGTFAQLGAAGVAAPLGRFFPSNTGSSITYTVGLSSFIVNPGQLQPNVTYYWYVNVTDVVGSTVPAETGGLALYTSSRPALAEIRAFTISNAAPNAVTNLTSPLITQTPPHTRKPTFIWSVPVDADGNDLHFKLWVSTGAPRAGGNLIPTGNAGGNGMTNQLTGANQSLQSTGTASGWSGGTDTTPPYTQGTSVASFTATSFLPYGTTFFWQVVANDGFSDQTALSSTGSFVLANSSPSAVSGITVSPSAKGFLTNPGMTFDFTASADGNGDAQNFSLHIFNFSSTTTALGAPVFSTNSAVGGVDASQVNFTTVTISGWSIARTTLTFTSGAVSFVMRNVIDQTVATFSGPLFLTNGATYYVSITASDGFLTTASTQTFVTGYNIENSTPITDIDALVKLGQGRSYTYSALWGLSRVNKAKIVGPVTIELTPSDLTDTSATLALSQSQTLALGPANYDVDFLDTQGNTIGGRSVGPNPMFFTIIYDTAIAVTVSVAETTEDGAVSVSIPAGAFTSAFSMDISTFPLAEGSVSTVTLNAAITAGNAAVSLVGGFETDTALSGRSKQFRPLAPGTTIIIQPVASVTLGLPDSGLGGLETSKQTRSDAFRLNPGTNVWDLILAAEGADPTIAGNIVSRGINRFSIFRVGLKKVATVDSGAALIYPNPWKPNSATDANFFATTVKIANLSAGTDITIYTVNGEVVRRLNSGAADRTTTNPLEWNGTNDSGRTVASGVYVILVESSTGRVKRRLAIVR